MKPVDWEELAALDAVGALEPPERKQLEEALSAGNSDARREVSSFAEATAALAGATACQPPASVRDRLMAFITGARKAEPPPGFSFVMADESQWLPHPVPGITYRTLALDRERDRATVIARLAPGTTYPSHHHSGPEECYVIAGEVSACGRWMKAGDFHHADGDSDHDPLHTDTGCTVILFFSARDFLEGLGQR